MLHPAVVLLWFSVQAVLKVNLSFRLEHIRRVTRPEILARLGASSTPFAFCSLNVLICAKWRCAQPGARFALYLKGKGTSGRAIPSAGATALRTPAHGRIWAAARAHGGEVPNNQKVRDTPTPPTTMTLVGATKPSLSHLTIRSLLELRQNTLCTACWPAEGPAMRGETPRESR